jgi:O-antigen/teichoic acid export membrane protein
VNLSLRGAAEIVGLVLSIITTVWVSRTVGPSYFGYYAVMLTIVNIGGVVINAGLSTAGSQRIANQPRGAGEILGIVTALRVCIAVVLIVGGLIVLAVAPVDPILRGYLLVGLIAWALLPLRSEWVLVAQGRVRVLSFIRVAASAASLLAAVWLVRDVSNGDRVAWIAVAGALVAALFSGIAAYRVAPVRRPAGDAIAIARAFLADGLHYLKADASALIFTSSDRLFLYAFATPAVVGLYEAAYRVIQPFYTISSVVGDAMYLQLAEALGTDRLRATFRRYVDLMCFATVPLGFFLLAFAPKVIAILYGTKYSGASEYLSILGWVITFGYTSGITVIPFSAWNRPREYGNSQAIGGALNLGLNFVLIPPFRGSGAAWATVAAKVAVTLAGLRYFRRVSDYPLIRDFAEYVLISGAAFVAGSVVSRYAPNPQLWGIIAFGLVYLALAALVRWRRYLPPRRASAE